jgi:hypothetical protein
MANPQAVTPQNTPHRNTAHHTVAPGLDESSILAREALQQLTQLLQL